MIDQWSSPTWRLHNLYYITDENGQRLLFRPNWAQAQFLEDMWDLNVILKARQLGFTTLIQLIMLDACVFNSDIRAGTIAHTREDAEAFFKDKVKYPYDNLPEQLRSRVLATQDSARQLTFSNNSSVRVGTSLRSGTFQYLHVSEYGKIGAKYPEKAIEIKTGAFNTVHAGQTIFVESTAEGQGGEFYEMCQTARSLERRGVELTPLDFKFHFFPWWRNPHYTLPHEAVNLTNAQIKYFNSLEKDHGVTLTKRQKAWYVKKAEQQGAYMKREFPSTPDEAFETAIEGAYFSHEMAQMELQGRVCDLPFERGIFVDTWWDLGMNDTMCIGFVQYVGGWWHVIDYYENSGMGLSHYASVMDEKRQEGGWTYGRHLWPHDGNIRIMDENGRKRKDVMQGLGYKVEIIQRPKDLRESIEGSRNFLSKVKMNRATTETLMIGLKNYRREWDEATATFKDRPLHNWASHRADMIRTGAEAKPKEPRGALVIPKEHISNAVI